MCSFVHLTWCFSQLIASLCDSPEGPELVLVHTAFSDAGFHSLQPFMVSHQKILPLFSGSSWCGDPHRVQYSHHLCSHPQSLIYRCPVTDISRSSSTLAPAATRCLSPRWHSIIFISWDKHGSLHLHLLARCLTLNFFFFYHPGILG